MSKVIVEKNKPKFDPIELNITISITTMEEYLQFRKDLTNIGSDWEFECELLIDLMQQLEEV